MPLALGVGVHVCISQIASDSFGLMRGLSGETVVSGGMASMVWRHYGLGRM